MAQQIIKRIRALARPNVFILLVIVIASSAVLILINYFTIKTLSAVRAYTNGESQYSKGQKDAARYMMLYIDTRNEAFWDSFRAEISVPIGDSLARVAMIAGASDVDSRKGFLQGRNHEDDLGNLIWLFKNFKDVSFMKRAIEIWKEADVLVGEEYTLGLEIHRKIKAGILLHDIKGDVVTHLNEITTDLTTKEVEFNSVLGVAARAISLYLFIVNIFIILIIVGSSSTYSIVMIRRLRKKNRDLTVTNRELDNFVYSASHDLRAPITSLKGLIEVLKLEHAPTHMAEYLELMDRSLDKQDQFIRDIIDFSKNKRIDIVPTEVSLLVLINEAIAQHGDMQQCGRISIIKDIRADKVMTDSLRLSIIINNLLSNAIKYSDLSKSNCFIRLTTFLSLDTIVFEIEDNGIGIKSENVSKIFEMFFVTNHSGRGSGLGLYITKETVEKLNGQIAVQSEFGIKTKFAVRIPQINEHKI